jgi:hypothetical protein
MMPRFRKIKGSSDADSRYADEVKSLVVKSVVGNSWKGQRRQRLSMGQFGEEELRQAQSTPRPGKTGSAGLKKSKKK